MTIDSEEGERATGKAKGSYITLELPPFSDNAAPPEEYYQAAADELRGLLPEEGLVLIVGMGNKEITPDALGPRCAAQILATRHITKELSRVTGLEGLRPTAVLAPGVLGQTGIEVLEILKSLCKSMSPSAVIVIDALASRSLERLGRTVQLSDAGISPGAGVGNNRPQISRETLGTPVIAVGVPTVVDAETLARDISGSEQRLTGSTAAGMIVTPREIDLLVERAARYLACSINAALHPDYDPLDLMSAV